MKKNVLIVVGILAVLAMVFVNATKADFVKTEGYEVGSSVADFSLKNVDGKMVSMGQFSEAKGFIVVFTCNTCPYSKMYEDRIESLNEKYASSGYPVIAINPNDTNIKPDDSFDAMVVRSQEKGFSFPYLHDESQEVAKTFGATRTPHVYLIQKESDDLKVAYIGAIDNNAKDASAVSERYLEDAVDSLIKGDKIENDFTKAIGCTIKWKQS